MSVIISNITPINYLVLIDHITVLHHLYAHVCMHTSSFRLLAMRYNPTS
jgi:predicted nucleic acid-binding protein